MYVFFTKRWNFFDRYNEVWVKLSNIIKKNIYQKICIQQKISNSWKENQQRKAFISFFKKK